MRLPFTPKADPQAREGKEEAKLQSEIAQAIEEGAADLKETHRRIRHRNNLGPKFAKALGAAPR